MMFTIPSTSTAGATSPGPTPSLDSESDYTSNSMIDTPCPAGNRDRLVADVEEEIPRTANSTILVPTTGQRSREERRLRDSLQKIRGRLEIARQLIDTMRATKDVRFVQEAVQRRELKIDEGEVQIETEAFTASGEVSVKTSLFLVFCVVLISVWWCWYNAAEMAYVRRRQREAFGLV